MHIWARLIIFESTLFSNKQTAATDDMITLRRPSLSRYRLGRTDTPPPDLFTGGRGNAGTLASNSYSTLLCTQGRMTMGRRREGREERRESMYVSKN